MTTIFTLTAVARGANYRTWGWYPTKMEAELAIMADNNDLIFESGTFTHAVIEEVPPGLMGGADKRETWWYQADYRGDGSYHVTPLRIAPQEFDGVVCFGMG